MNPDVEYYQTPSLAHFFNLFLENKDKMIKRIKPIRYLFRLTCASFIPRLRTSRSELGRYLWFELGFPVRFMKEAHVGYPIGYSINVFLGLVLCNSFEKWERSLVGVSLITLYGFMICTGERSLVGISLGLTFGSPL